MSDVVCQSSQAAAAKPKPPKPTGFPVVPGVYRLDGTRLASLGEDFLLADLVSPADPPFFEPGTAWEMAFQNVEPRQYFDALVWLRQARKMAPLAWPSCR